MVYTTCEGFSGTKVRGEGLVVYIFSHAHIILISDFEGGIFVLKEEVKW